MSKYATMVPARIRVETRPRSLAVPASWPRCSISCTVRCESCDQRETLAEAGINYVLSGHGLSNGHHCRICGRVRPNEQFPGKGHKIHVCKRCQRVPKKRTAGRGRPGRYLWVYAPISYFQEKRGSFGTIGEVGDAASCQPCRDCFGGSAGHTLQVQKSQNPCP